MMISVPQRRAAEFKSAMAWLEQRDSDWGSRLIVKLILSAAKAAGWPGVDQDDYQKAA